MEAAIRSQLWDLVETDQIPESVEVDISYSVLGNEKELKGIFDVLLPQQNGKGLEKAVPIQVNFITRGNRISPKTMDALLQRILHVNESKTADMSFEKGENYISEDNKNATNQGKTSSHMPWKVATLDAGWNALHPDSEGWKKFVKSLEKLIQSSSHCPKCIRLDRCGLGPAACRAIGKVSKLRRTRCCDC